MTTALRPPPPAGPDAVVDPYATAATPPPASGVAGPVASPAAPAAQGFGWPGALELGLVAVLCATAGLAFAGAYRFDGGLAASVVLAAVLPVVLAGLVRQRGALPGLMLAGLNVAAFVAVALLVTQTAALSTLVDGLINGWRHLLTSTSPVDPTPDVVLFPVEAVWLAAAVSSALVVRSRTVLAPLVPPFLVFLLALLCGGGGEAGHEAWPQVAGFCASAVLLVASRRGGGREEISTGDPLAIIGRRFLAALPLLALVVLVSFLIGPLLLPDRPAVDLHDHVDESPEPRQALNPVLYFGAARRAVQPGSAAPVYFRVDASAPVERYTLAVLDGYDGQQWQSAGTYRRVGRDLPADPTWNIPTRTIDQRVTVVDLPGYWLPAAQRPRAVVNLDRGPPILYDQRAGILATSRPPKPGRAGVEEGGSRGQQYVVTSSVPDVRDDRLQAARVPVGPEVAPLLALPGDLPAVFRDRAVEQTTTGAPTPYLQAAALERYVRGLGQAEGDKATAGHSAALLEPLLKEPGKVGSPEQKAALYAIMARTIGLPSRVVVGFQPQVPRAGEMDITATEATVWPEVYFADLGWVPFSVTSDQGAKAPDAGSSKDVEVEQAPGIQRPPATLPSDPGMFAPPAEEGASLLTRVLVVVLLVVGAMAVGLLCSAIATTSARRRLHRRRRQAPTPEERIVGAWEDVQDRLVELDVRDTDSLTARELALTGAAVVPGPAAEGLRPLGALANLARYSPWRLAPDQAEVAWRYADAFAGAQKDRLSATQRVKRLFVPRRLQRRH